MKKYLFFSFLFLFFGMSLKAQDDDARLKFSAGAKAGLNIANVWDTQGQDFKADPKAGFAGGVFVIIPIGEILGLQPEVLVSQKGFSASGTLLGSEYSLKRTTTYIDVPILLQIKPAEFITLLVGPQYSYLMHQKDVYTFGTASVVQEQAFQDQSVRKNIFGLVAGVDFNIGHFVIAPRMGWDLLNNSGDGTSTTPRYRNRWVQLTVGVKL